MQVVKVSADAATLTLTAIEVVALLTAVTQLDDLSQQGLAFLDETRQPEVDGLYGDLYKLAEEMSTAT